MLIFKLSQKWWFMYFVHSFTSVHKWPVAQANFISRYLHEVCSPSVIHKNFKSANILLDTELNPHLSDCGLASLVHEPDQVYISQSSLISFPNNFGRLVVSKWLSLYWRRMGKIKVCVTLFHSSRRNLQWHHICLKMIQLAFLGMKVAAFPSCISAFI